MPEKPYLLSFTGASLSIRESIKIAEVYVRLGDWDTVKAEVKGANLIQARTQSSIQRVYQELHPRLAGLSDAQLELLVEGNPQELMQSEQGQAFMGTSRNPLALFRSARLLLHAGHAVCAGAKMRHRSLVGVMGDATEDRPTVEGTYDVDRPVLQADRPGQGVDPSGLALDQGQFVGEQAPP